MGQPSQNKKIPGLKKMVECILRLEACKASIVTDIKALYSQAKGQDLDIKTLQQFIKLQMKQAKDASYSGHVLAYKETFEAELYHLFEQDPERCKRDYFNWWIQWANKPQNKNI